MHVWFGEEKQENSPDYVLLLTLRWGGEEFAVIVSSVNKKGLSNVSERILSAMNSKPVMTSDGMVHITVSIGCTYKQADALTSTDELIAQADGAMMEAKKQGRNRIICGYSDST